MIKENDNERLSRLFDGDIRGAAPNDINREKWTKAGREHIEKIDLTPETQAKKVYDLLIPFFEEE